MDRCTGCQDITEILFKTALNTIQSINMRLEMLKNVYLALWTFYNTIPYHIFMILRDMPFNALPHNPNF